MDTLEALKALVDGMGGTVIAAHGRSVGFSMIDGGTRTLYKLVAEGDDVVLHQLGGRERGKHAVIACLRELTSKPKSEPPQVRP